jgi:carbonic anhydrase
MRKPFKHRDIHHCEGVVLTCVDFRFWNQAIDFINNCLGIADFDFPSIPGAAKAINENAELALNCIAIPCNLHHAQKIVLIHHQDCGAYGGLKNFGGDKKMEQAHHEGELRKAKKIILGKYPDREVTMVFASLTDDDHIEFLTIK